MRQFLSLTLATALLAGGAVTLGAPAQAKTPAAIAAAVAAPERPASDKARDAQRKPAEVMAFFGIKPGQSILDLYSGSGYYSELLFRAVGPKGSVTAHNSPGEVLFVKDDLAVREYARRLPGVHLLTVENNHLTLAPNSFDVIWYVQSYHDIALDEEGWPKIDGVALRAELFKALKPGGTFAIVDHVAVAGSDPIVSGQKLHRIDPAVVLREMKASGFELVKTSSILANPADDHSKIVFDPTIRGKTDQFMMLFRKPKA